jgi:putative glutamine amidotransferase
LPEIWAKVAGAGSEKYERPCNFVERGCYVGANRNGRQDMRALTRRPVVGIIGNSHSITETYLVHGAGVHVSRAVAEVVECLPIILPSDLGVVDIGALLDTCDGFLFPGGRPNVHPEEYGAVETPAHGSFDRERDALALGLVRACVERGQPILGICRGFQEFNVAMGGTLHAEVRDLPGRLNHRMPPDGTPEEIFALRHMVRFQQGGVFAKLMGADEVMTNTLHGQAIDRAGPRVVVDGVAPDETPEALYIEGAAGFALAVQWHPEWNAARDPVSKALFSGFGDAVRAWAAQS